MLIVSGKFKVTLGMYKIKCGGSDLLSPGTLESA